MGKFYCVRKPNGKYGAWCRTRDGAEREIAWQIASGAAGEFSIEERQQPELLGWGVSYTPRRAERWPAAKVDEFKRRYMDGEPLRLLEEIFNTNISQICKRAREFGFIRRIDDPRNFEKHNGRWTERELELINHMYDEGFGVGTITEHHPRRKSAIEAALRSSAKRLSTRSRFGRFIRSGKTGIRRTLEEASSVGGDKSEGDQAGSEEIL